MQPGRLTSGLVASVFQRQPLLNESVQPHLRRCGLTVDADSRFGPPIVTSQ